MCKKHITVYHQQTRCRWWWYILLLLLLLSPPKRPQNRKLWSLSWICYVHTPPPYRITWDSGRLFIGINIKLISSSFYPFKARGSNFFEKVCGKKNLQKTQKFYGQKKVPNTLAHDTDWVNNVNNCTWNTSSLLCSSFNRTFNRQLFFKYPINNTEEREKNPISIYTRVKIRYHDTTSSGGFCCSLTKIKPPPQIFFCWKEEENECLHLHSLPLSLTHTLFWRNDFNKSMMIQYFSFCIM